MTLATNSVYDSIALAKGDYVEDGVQTVRIPCANQSRRTAMTVEEIKETARTLEMCGIARDIEHALLHMRSATREADCKAVCIGCERGLEAIHNGTNWVHPEAGPDAPRMCYASYIRELMKGGG